MRGGRIEMLFGGSSSVRCDGWRFKGDTKFMKVAFVFIRTQRKDCTGNTLKARSATRKGHEGAW